MTNLDLYNINWGQELEFPNSRTLRNTPHVIGGRYPCRSVAFVPAMILRSFIFEDRTISVLDPFMGSGTTAIEACKYTDTVWGLEVDPYARLIATVATRKYTALELKRLDQQIKHICENFHSITPDTRFEPELENIRYWFCESNFDAMLKLKTAIYQTSNNERHLEFLLTILGDIVRSCSKAERQSLKPYISKKYPKTPKPVLPQFEQTSRQYLHAISVNEKNLGDGIHWGAGDATKFDLADNIHLAITSPPYINAIDYVRCVKLESAWVGKGNDSSLLKVRATQLGEEIRTKKVKMSQLVENEVAQSVGDLEALDSKRYAIVRTFFQDMFDNLRSVFSALSSDGEYYLIIGNSTIRGIEVPTHKIVAKLAERVGFAWKGYFKYQIRDHRMSIPRQNRGGKINWEHVVRLQKINCPITCSTAEKLSST